MNPNPLNWPTTWAINNKPVKWTKSSGRLGTLLEEQSYILREMKLLKVSRFLINSNGEYTSKNLLKARHLKISL